MTIYQNTADGGTNGTTQSAANSGGNSGDALIDPTITGAGTITYATASALRGLLGYHIVGVSTSGKHFIQLSPGSPTNTTGFRTYCRFTTLPSAAMAFFAGNNATTTNRIDMTVSNTGAMQVLDQAGTAIGTWSGASTTSAVNLVAGIWYRFDFTVNNTGANGSNGSIGGLTIYAGHNRLAYTSWSNGGCNLGANNTATIAGVAIGRIATGTQTFDMDVDNIKVDTSGAVAVGPALETYALILSGV